MRVHHVGPDPPDQFGDPPDLGGQFEPGVAGRFPDLGLGAQRGGVGAEGPLFGAGDDDPHSGADLCPYEIRDDPAHSSVDRLDEMEHREAGTGSVHWWAHAQTHSTHGLWVVVDRTIGLVLERR